VPKIKPDEHFDRRQVRFPQWKLSAWARDTEQTIEDWQRMRADLGVEERWPQHEQGCWHYNKRCPFWERCNVPEERAQTLEGYRYGDFWEPSKARSGSATT
jgi:hypothetical protein